MITYDPAEPTVLRVEPAHVDAVLTALAGRRPFEGSDQIDPEVLDMMGTVLSGPRGALRLESAGHLYHVAHNFTLSAEGSLRRSSVRPNLEELAFFPTPVLAGVLLRLLQLAPVEPLAPDVRIAVPTNTLSDLFTEDHEARETPLSALQEIASSLPPARDAQLEDAPLRAHRLSRVASTGDRVAHVLMLRGRYLRAQAGGLGTVLVGTDPTGAHRAISDLLNPRR